MAHTSAHTPPYTPPHSPLPQCHRPTYYHLRSPEDSGESDEDEDTDYCNEDIMERMEIDEDTHVHPQAQSPFLSLCPEVRFYCSLSALFLVRSERLFNYRSDDVSCYDGRYLHFVQ